MEKRSKELTDRVREIIRASAIQLVPQRAMPLGSNITSCSITKGI
jgi:hypothetical protein